MKLVPRLIFFSLILASCSEENHFFKMATPVKVSKPPAEPPPPEPPPKPPLRLPRPPLQLPLPPPPPPPPQPITETFIQWEQREEVLLQKNVERVGEGGSIDILWVIDDSRSIPRHRSNKFTNNLDPFIEHFLSFDRDFQMAVIASRDLCTNNPDRGNGRLTSQQAKQDKANFLSLFKRAIEDVLLRTPSINCVQSFFTAGKQFFKAHPNWRREGSKLIIINVSDQDDVSACYTDRSANAYDHVNFNRICSIHYAPHTWKSNTPGCVSASYENHPSVKEYADKMKLLGGEVYSITHLQAKDWAFHCGYYGGRLEKATELTGGVKGDLLGDYNVLFNKFASSILVTNFMLSRRVDDSEKKFLVIAVNGRELNKSDWNYHKVSNTITFDIVLAQGDKVKVSLRGIPNRSFTLKHKVDPSKIGIIKVKVKGNIVPSTNRWEYKKGTSSIFFIKLEHAPSVGSRIEVTYYKASPSNSPSEIIHPSSIEGESNEFISPVGSSD